jgi:hypothetical protein
VSLSSEKCLFVNTTVEKRKGEIFRTSVHKSRIFSSAVNSSPENDKWAEFRMTLATNALPEQAGTTPLEGLGGAAPRS